MNECSRTLPETGSGPSDGEIRGLLEELGVCRDSNLITILQEVQDRLGYLPPHGLEAISRRMKVPLSRVYGVVSFYSQFYTEPRGRHTVRACRGTACHVRGGRHVIQAIRNALGIEDGQTTADQLFSFETVACLGACALSPVMIVDSTYYGKATPRRVQEVLKRIVEAHQAGSEAQ